MRVNGRRSPLADDLGPGQNVDPLVEAIAARVVELLTAPADADRGAEMVSAAALAEQLGVSRDFVYEHKLELGGVPLGNGPRPRWAFDPAEVRRRLAARRVSERSTTADAPAAPARLPHRGRARKGDGVALLPIRGDRRAA